MLWFFKLKKHCEPKFGDPPYIRALRIRASSLLGEKLILTPTHKIATFLCPRFKSLKMLTPGDRQEVMRNVCSLVTDSHDDREGPEEGTTITEEPDGHGDGSGQIKKQKTDYFAEWQDKPNTANELDEYCSVSIPFEGEDLLSFWEKQGHSFRRLRSIARRML